MPDTEVQDPIAAMLAVDDEQMRGRELPEPELNTEAPADKPAVERDETGKFKAKDGKEDEKPKDEPKAEKPEAKPDDKPKETVPLATFLEKTNKLKSDLEAKDITLKQYEQRLAALEAKLPKPEAPKEPDFVEDPKGYVDHKLSQTLSAIEAHNAKVAEEGKKATETATATAEQVQLQRFMTDLTAHESRFVQANPDYHDALQHVRGVRAAQLREFAPDITEQQIIETIRSEEINLAVQLAKQGRDPVQTAYNLARHYGYQRKEAVKETPKLPEVKENRLPPDQTLGAGSSEAVREDVANPDNPIDIALASLFKKRA